MARVVQRQAAPPYLAILFVFLFLIAAALAGVFYSYWSDEKKQRVQAIDEMNVFIAQNERGSEEIAALKERARRGSRKSVVGLLRADRDELIVKIIGTRASVGQALQSARKTLERLDESEGLIPAARDRDDKWKAAQKRIAGLNSQIATLNGQVQDKEAALQQAQAAFTRDAAEHSKQMASLRRQITTLSASYDTNLANAGKEWGDKLAAKDQELANKDEEARALDQEIRAMKRKLNELRTELAQRKPKGPGMPLGPAGQVLRAAEREGAVYINIGREDRVRIGLTFSVHSARTGVDPQGVGKAKIIVRDVDDTIAECHVLESTPADPIIEGDLVYNPAFDSTRKPVFVVEGEFDLDADGEVDQRGADRIRAMIAEYGGKVTKQVDARADFVVLGEPPAVPPKPAPSAPAVDRKRYEDKVEQVREYNHIRNLALDWRIPVLNANRFLAFVGYSPGTTTR